MSPKPGGGGKVLRYVSTAESMGKLSSQNAKGFQGPVRERVVVLKLFCGERRYAGDGRVAGGGVGALFGREN